MGYGRKRTPAQQKKAEAGYRKDVLSPHADWQRELKATAKNGSVAALRKLERQLHDAIGRLEGFLNDPEHFGT